MIYAAVTGGVLVASARDGSWQTGRRLAGASTQCIAADPSRPEVIYCGTFDRGLWRSVDAGDSWERVGEDTIRGPVTSVAVGSAERAGEDGGVSWRNLEGLRELPSEPGWSFPPRPETHHARWISPDPNVAGTVFVAIEAGGLGRALHGGETWGGRTPDGPRGTH